MLISLHVEGSITSSFCKCNNGLVGTAAAACPSPACMPITSLHAHLQPVEQQNDQMAEEVQEVEEQEEEEEEEGDGYAADIEDNDDDNYDDDMGYSSF